MHATNDSATLCMSYKLRNFAIYNSIAIDVQIGMRANDVAESLRSAFERHRYLQEVWLYKGGRRIMVRRQWAESKEFMKEFRKAWAAKK